MDYRNDRKIEVIKKLKSSRAIYREIESELEQWYWETNNESLEVDEVPDGVDFEIRLMLEVLNDLANYTEHVKSNRDGDLSQELQYIEPFWTSKGVECEEQCYG